MAFDNLGEYALRRDNELLKRTAVAIVKIAFDVYSEDPATPLHTQRIAWVNRVTASEESSDNEARRMLPVLVRHPFIQTSGTAVTDTQIGDIISAYLNFFVANV